MKLSALIVTTLTSLVLSCPDQHDQTGHESQTQIFVLPIPPAVKAPVIHPEPVRSTCAQYGLFEHGLFTMYNNLWNQPKATGTQCSVLQQGSNQSVSWSTTWNWQPKTHQPNVISYANVEMSFESLSDISNYTSISTRWQAEYTCSNHVANVAYDIFLENEKDGQVVTEIMIWLSAFGGAKPISATGVPIVGITLANKNWQLFKGRNDGSAMDVYSFVAHDAESARKVDFTADLMEFLDYLTNEKYIPTGQNLQKIGAGTEAFKGKDCVFDVHRYFLEVEQ